MTVEHPVERRQEIFAALVKEQDDGKPVRTSRTIVAGRYGITVAEVEAVEKEGLAEGWPPL